MLALLSVCEQATNYLPDMDSGQIAVASDNIASCLAMAIDMAGDVHDALERVEAQIVNGRQG